MKNFIYLFVLMCLIATMYFLFKISPYHIYHIALDSGIKSTYLNLSVPKKYKNNYLTPNANFTKNNVVTENNDLWKKVHLENFELLLPINDLNYNISPEIFSINNRIKFGLNFLNLNNDLIFKIELLDEGLLSLNIRNNKIFKLPFFRNYISSMTISDLWSDIFNKNLNIENLASEFSILNYKKYIKYDYRELVYNLYVLHFRINLLSQAREFYGYERSDHVLGIIKIKPSNEYLFDDYIIHILRKQRFERIKISIKRNDKRSSILNKMLLNNIVYKENKIDSAIALYSYFKQLSYRKKTSQAGMVILFSAWSHDKKNINYYKELIFWLEKGNVHTAILKKLYNFGHEHYGSNFSNIKENRIETEQIAMERELEEEQMRELNREDEVEVLTSDEILINKLNQSKMLIKRNNEIGKKLRVR